MNDFPTYYDIKYANTSKIFESELIKDLTPDQIQEAEKAYNILVEKLQKGETIDEGLISGLLIGGTSALLGPTIMKAICKTLGIDENGALGKLLTSKLVLASIGFTLGK